MKKTYLPVRLGLGFVALLLGSSVAYGYTYNDPFLVPAAPQVAFSGDSGGLTPKRAKVPVAPDQQPTKQDSSVHIPVIPATPAPVRGTGGTEGTGGIRLAQASTEPVLPPVAVPPPVVVTPVVLPPVVAVPAAAPPVETPALRTQVSSNNDSHIYSELDRLNAEIQKLKKETAKPDTKKAWSAPRISGRFFLDSVNFIDQNTETTRIKDNMQNAAGFRELRLGAAGSGYDSFDYKIEFGFNNNLGRVALVDNWVGVKNVPLLGYVRAGHFKPETGQYYLMGSTQISAMEYITPANVFGLGRRIGISSENLFAHDRMRLFFGVFQNGTTDMDRYLTEDNQGQVVNLRLTAAPWFAQEGRCLFHVGGHWEYAGLDSKSWNNDRHRKETSRSTTPGTFGLGVASILTTGNFANDYSNRGGLEFAYQYGRFSARSELFAGSFNVKEKGQGKHLYGSYVELGYFLTDDFRTYDLKTGAFGAVKTKRNFHPYKHGEWHLIDSFGAWQAIFQWGYTDMEDWRGGIGKDSIGGHQNDFVAGLNWFWSPQMRWIFQYVHSRQCIGSEYLHLSQDIFATSIRYHW